MTAHEPRGDIPTGVVTFLFSDVEGSTASWAADAEAMAASLRVHDRLVRDAIETAGGYVFTTAGDAFCAAFQRATDAVGAARQIQTALAGVDWPGPALKVRMGLHLGEAEERGGDYFGPTLNVAARVAAAGHGGQILVTEGVRVAAALAAAHDLGEHGLKDVPERVRLFQLGDGEFPTLRSTGGRSNLPVPATRLVGRDDDVRAVRLLLAQHRLVTLMAVGGTGKTRLAIEVADQELPRWRDGVWFVDLTQAGSDDDVAVGVAAAIGLELIGADVAAQVARYVAGRSMLIVLDNCEHLIDGAAELAEAILAQGGSSKILATSREWLDIDFEHVFQVPSLDTDSDDSPAVRLFIERARASNPGFEPEADGVIAELCRRLDGMPLAIELAAARVAVLPPTKLLEGLDDRFRLLSGGRRRQRGRTLEATIDWSYDLLADDEQRFFRRLGVFLGSFDLAAAAAVGDVPIAEATDLVEALYARSLVAPSKEWPGRFQLLETLKAYAEARLVDAGEANEARERLYRHFAPTGTPTLVLFSMSLEQVTDLAPDQANLAQIASWLDSAARWNELADLTLHTCLSTFRNPADAVARIHRLRPHVDDPEVDAELAECQVLLAMWASDWRTFVRSCLELCGLDDPHHAGVGHMMLHLTTATVDRAGAHELLDRFAEMPSRLRPEVKRMWELGARANIEAMAGNAESARSFASEVIAIVAAGDFLRDWLAVLPAQQTVGVCCWVEGDDHGLAQVRTDIAEVVGSVADPIVTSFGDLLSALASIADEQDVDRNALRDYLSGYASGQFAQGESDGIVVLTALCVVEGDAERAIELLKVPLLPRSPAGWLVLHTLADRLGVADEVLAGRRAAAGGPLDLETPRRLLRTELERRGWDV